MEVGDGRRLGQGRAEAGSRDVDGDAVEASGAQREAVRSVKREETKR